MLNEWQEFQTYTGKVNYTAEDTRDVAYMRRFTFEMLLDFEGLVRVLTIIARGYLFHDREGEILSGNPRARVDYARRALCAWCSVPDRKKASAGDTDITTEEKKYATEFAELHEEFPELVDKRGNGWLCRHVKGIANFMAEHPEKVRKTSSDKLPALKKFNTAWRRKVRQFQIPAFSDEAKGQWNTRFDNVLVEALELGSLRRMEVDLPTELMEKIRPAIPAEVPEEVVFTLVAYYIANRQEDTDWVILPVTNFSAYLRGSFGRKYLPKLPKELCERNEHSHGVCRFRVDPRYTA